MSTTAASRVQQPLHRATVAGDDLHTGLRDMTSKRGILARRHLAQVRDGLKRYIRLRQLSQHFLLDLGRHHARIGAVAVKNPRHTA